MHWVYVRGENSADFSREAKASQPVVRHTAMAYDVSVLGTAGHLSHSLNYSGVIYFGLRNSLRYESANTCLDLL